MQYTPYIIPLLFTAALTAFTAAYALRHRSVMGASGVALIGFAAAWWCFAYTLEMGAGQLPEKLFWSKMVYPGIVVVPVGWLIFALQYTGGEKWLSRRNLLLLWLVPLATLLLVFTNDSHKLFWSYVWLARDLRVFHGPLFWAWAIFAYACVSLAVLLLLRAIAQRKGLYRWQAGAMALAGLVPWLVNFAYLSGLNPWPFLDPTPFSFAASGVAITWTLFRFRLLDIMPIAHHAVFNSMSDGVLILDDQNRVIDLNPAAQAMTGIKAEQAIGKPAVEVLHQWSTLIEQYRSASITQADVAVGEGDLRKEYELRISPLTDFRGEINGRLIMLRDITKRKAREKDEHEQRLIAEALRDTAADLTSTLDIQEVLSRILLNLGRVAPHNAANIMFVENGIGRFASCRGYAELGFEKLLMGMIVHINEVPNLKFMVETCQPVLCRDTHENTTWVPMPETAWVRSYMGAPLVIKGEVIGFIHVDSAMPNFFSETHLQNLRAFAEQASIAIENARAYQELQQLAVTDEVTGLYNRRKFFDLGQQEVERTQRSGQPLSAIILDLDYFKGINDTYGHVIGDYALRSVARLCRENLRSIDIIGRYGGDEIVILLQECDADTAHRIATRLCQVIAETCLVTNRGDLRLTASLGVSTMQGETLNLLALINHADQALYQAKQSGRNRVRVKTN